MKLKNKKIIITDGTLAVPYLSSDDFGFVNGTALYIDNAWYA